ncbi:DUF2019 domain-containing protein [Nitratireductor luteus]|uniref:DUF2019 domain-containing protein n=1 Tax=Nitratireductor luteus TaxID=2976980 RepID=UPI00223FB5C7|nr:DUF2019 domain-containing protein [Nitratireductor luteus]
MTKTSLELLSTAQLISRFAEIGAAQYEAELDLDTRRYNRLYDQMTLVSQELKRRPGDERSHLSELYGHPNIQVRLKAAVHTLAVHPEEAREVLEEVAARSGYPQSGDARGILRALHDRSYVPE